VSRLTGRAGTIQEIDALHRADGANRAIIDEEGLMTDRTRRITARLRQAARRLDSWTVTVFNPRYPTPRDRD
jgi:hypothetical protein